MIYDAFRENNGAEIKGARKTNYSNESRYAALELYTKCHINLYLPRIQVGYNSQLRGSRASARMQGRVGQVTDEATLQV